MRALVVDDLQVVHLSNVIYGAPFVNTLGQVGLAATSGAILYLFRRGTGLLAAGMVAHGVWDMSLFLPGGGGGVFGAIASVALLGIMPALGVAVLIVSLVRDGRLVVTQSGVETANVDWGRHNRRSTSFPSLAAGVAPSCCLTLPAIRRGPGRLWRLA